MIILLIYGPYLFISLITLFCGNIFTRLSVPRKLARQPLINVFYWFKIARTRPVFAILLFVPYINLVFIFVMLIAIIRSYVAVKNASTVAWPFVWIDIIIFMLLMRAIINTFIIGAFSIPTSSMEKTFTVGETVIAEKVSYGPRLPNTPLSIPFFRSRLPNSNKLPYFTWLLWPYYRFPGNTHIARNDVIVFNYPMQNQYPVDKREYYMKRCVGLPGDTLQIVDGTLYINGQKAFEPPLSQKTYLVKTDGTAIEPHTLEALNITDGGKYTTLPGLYLLGLTVAAKDSLKALPNVKMVEKSIKPKGLVDVQSHYFPADTGFYKWNADQYGPIIIPQKGATIKLNADNLYLYLRIINIYEHTQLSIHDYEEISIDGKKTDSYTFKMNYYFVMGDNRDNSEDSRFWGFVPEDHIDGRVWKAFKMPFSK